MKTELKPASNLHKLNLYQQVAEVKSHILNYLAGL